MTWEQLKGPVMDAIAECRLNPCRDRVTWLEPDTLTISKDVAEAITDFPVSEGAKIRFCGLTVVVSPLLVGNTMVVTTGPLQAVRRIRDDPQRD